ncbi:MAG: BTAD domain-containing putative transcriptional regulator, partial [Micromonosporaceae bacterium]
MSAPHVNILGPVEVWVGDQQTHLTKLERALIAILALQRGRVVTVGRLADLLWSGVPPNSGHSRVQSLVSSVRRTLLGAGSDDGLIHTRPSGYTLVASDRQLDLGRFEALVAAGRGHAGSGQSVQAAAALRTALELWRGRPLDGVASFAIGAEAERLEELRLLVFEELVDAELALGEVKQLIPDLRAELSGNPAREHLRGQLMRALHSSGRTGEALQVYRAGYQVLRDQLGIEPGPELQALHQQILTSGEEPAEVSSGRPSPFSPSPEPADPVTSSPAERGPGPSRRPAAASRLTSHQQRPNQLPPQIPSLVGREREAVALREALLEHQDESTAAPALIALSGMGGVGKTALAVAVAHAVRRSYPDGCLFADLRNHQTTPTDPMELIGSFLQALGVSTPAIPDEPDARLACYRSQTADRALLIVLDNAREEAQIRPLIPASGKAGVLITSRAGLLGLDGARPVRLDVLSLPAAVDLLTSLVGPERVEREPEAARRLAFLCGGLPLALRVTAARLAARFEMSLQDAVDRLADEHRRLSDLAVGDVSVRSSLQWSYQRLGATARLVMRRLGTSTVSDFPAWLPGVLAGSDDAFDSAVLDQLVDSQLLEQLHCPWTAAIRYRTHDLVRLFCRERSLEEDSDQARADALRHTCQVLLQVAVIADAQLPVHAYPSTAGGLPDAAVPTSAALVARASPVGWFEAERLRLLEAIDEAIGRGWLDLAWRLVASMTNFLELTSRLEEGLRLHRDTREALIAYVAAKGQPVDRAAEAALLLGEARFLRASQRNAEALRSSRRARVLFRRLGNLPGQACSAVSFGVAARTLTKPRLALAAFGHALRITQGTLPIYEGYALLGVGNVLMDYGGDFAEAAPLLERAVELLASCGDQRGEANAL